jgi:hypothetical protein
MTEHTKEKEKLKKEYLRRLRLIFNTELTVKNKIQAIGSLDRTHNQSEQDKGSEGKHKQNRSIYS